MNGVRKAQVSWTARLHSRNASGGRIPLLRDRRLFRLCRVGQLDDFLGCYPAFFWRRTQARFARVPTVEFPAAAVHQTANRLDA